MCGVAGIIGRNVTGIEARIVEMSGAIRHRGPDDDNIIVWPVVGHSQTSFAHRRLSILDLTRAGRQPMTTPNGRYSIVFNGEIYNYVALRKDLAQEGIRFETETDTEVLLQLYARFGAECLKLLRGMFAFAIRDNETGEVFAARDRLGIKPLYYYAGQNGVLFASEVRSLLASGLVPRLVDPISLNSYLSFGAVQEPRTIIQDVRTLPPAHYLRVTVAGQVAEVAPYWALPKTEYGGTQAEALEETRSRLEESVKSHLVADVPLAAFLSGGIDSSAIIALMSKYATQAVQTFTICFDEHEFSERKLAQRVAEKWGTLHTEVVLTEDNLLAALPRATSDIDQPTIDGVNTWVVARSTKHAGITVALSGLGGDELFGGYPSFQRVQRFLRYATPITLINTATRNAIASFAVKVAGNSLSAQKVMTALCAGGDALSVYASIRGLFSKASRHSLVRKNGFIKRDYDLPEETLSLLESAQPDVDIFNRVSRYELSLYMANMLLRDTDTMSMAHALEVRVPLLDHRLVEWVYALPEKIKVGHPPKALLVDALGADIPAEVIHQRKMGFTLPFERWLHTALKPMMKDILNDGEAVARAGLDPAGVADVYARFVNRSRSTSWSRIWGLAILVDWCRRHDVEAAA